MLKTHPAVFAVEDEYQIMVCVKAPCLMWVQVGDEKYFDESNGILRSNVTTHRMKIPAELLNQEKKYTVCWRKIIDRKPYFPETEDEQRLEYTFRPLKNEKTVMYHISDAHNMVDAPVAASRGAQDEAVRARAMTTRMRRETVLKFIRSPWRRH